jgi:biopolymer transport protein ExbD
MRCGAATLIVAVAAALAISGCNSESSTGSDIVTLEVLSDGTFIWNGERVPDAESLDKHWKAVAAQNPQPEIHLKPNRDATYDAVERALSGAQRNGVTRLGFVGNVAP